MIVKRHTSIQGSTRTLVIQFAVANFKYNILATFLEKNEKTLNTEYMSLTVNGPHESNVNTFHRKKKNYPHFPYIYPLTGKNKFLF